MSPLWNNRSPTAIYMHSMGVAFVTVAALISCMQKRIGSCEGFHRQVVARQLGSV